MTKIIRRTNAKPAPRKARAHNSVPPYWRWHDGKPRWTPSEGLRKAGWKSTDLRGADGQFLGQGASIDRAAAINAQVAQWRAGEPIEPAFAHVAPPGAAIRGGAGAPPPAGKFSVGALIDAYAGVPGDKKGEWTIKPSEEFADLASTTQVDYRSKLKRLVDVFAGYVEQLPRDASFEQRREYERLVAEARAEEIYSLEPAEGHDGIEDPLYEAYWALHRQVGVHMAHGVLAVAGAWLSWCRQRKSRKIYNWAGEVKRETPPGRIRPLTVDEINALVWAAEQLGLYSMADSIVLGVDLSWSLIDRLCLTWDRLKDGRALTGQDGRQKTGRVGGTPLSTLGLARVAKIRERQARMDAHPTHILWNERTGRPWVRSTYSHVFGDEVRPLAATKCPSVAGARDQDLRDTAITWAREAGLDDDQLVSRSLQSRQHVKGLLDKHYGEIGPEIADRGVERLNAYLAKKGIKA